MNKQVDKLLNSKEIKDIQRTEKTIIENIMKEHINN